MRAASVLVGLLCLLGLSGCTDPQAPAAGGGTNALMPTGNLTVPIGNLTLGGDPAFDVDFGAEGCHGGQVWINVNRQLLGNELPAGFETADAADLAGPRGNGRGLASIETYTCGKNALGSSPLAYGLFAIYVNPPKVGDGLPPAKSNWYALQIFTHTDTLLQLLRPSQARLVEGLVKNTVAATGGVTTSDGEANDEAGKIFSFQVASAVSTPGADFTRRVWQVAPDGLLRFDQTAKADLIEGQGRCDVRAGSTVYQVAKTSSCLPQDTFSSWVWDHAQWTGRAVFAPGANATAPA
jgi:hypothetical protein